MKFAVSPQGPIVAAALLILSIAACSQGGTGVLLDAGATTGLTTGTTTTGTTTATTTTGTTTATTTTGTTTTGTTTTGTTTTGTTTATTTTGTTTGTTSTGGGGDAGQGGMSLCDQAKMPPISAVICDGFETTPSAFTVMPAGSMTVDTTQFYRGGHSMFFAPSTMAYLVESSSFTGTTKATNNNFWGRYFFLSAEAADTDYDQGHTVFGTMVGMDTGAGSNPNADQFHFVGGAAAVLQTQIQFASDVFSDKENGAAKTDPKYPIMSDGWQCWEWQLTSDDTYHFYIGGAEVTEMEINMGKGVFNGANFSPLPLVTSLELGWQAFGSGKASGWIDEVAIGPTRIGCGN